MVFNTVDLMKSQFNQNGTYQSWNTSTLYWFIGRYTWVLHHRYPLYWVIHTISWTPLPINVLDVVHGASSNTLISTATRAPFPATNASYFFPKSILWTCTTDDNKVIILWCVLLEISTKVPVHMGKVLPQPFLNWSEEAGLKGWIMDALSECKYTWEILVG